MKGEALLKQMGFNCRIVKPDGNGSCRYAIELSCNNIRKAIDIISSAKIPIYSVTG